jgi:transcription initiation factor TFIIIB Brf1 subunit/transcription initiation factor TFIIB
MNYTSNMACPFCGSNNVVISDDSKRVCNNCGDEICTVIDNNLSCDKSWKNNSSEQHIKNVIVKTYQDIKNIFGNRIPDNVIKEICEIYREILIDKTNRAEIKLGIIGHCIDYVCAKNKIYISQTDIINRLKIEKKNFDKSLIMFEKLVGSKTIPSLSTYYYTDQMTFEEIINSIKNIISVSEKEIKEFDKSKYDDENFSGENYLCAVFLYGKIDIKRLTEMFDISETTLKKLKSL